MELSYCYHSLNHLLAYDSIAMVHSINSNRRPPFKSNWATNQGGGCTVAMKPPKININYNFWLREE